MKTNLELRRYEIINSDKEGELLRLLNSKKLSREDLNLILNTIRLGNDMLDLSKVSTKALAEELEKRTGVQVFKSQLYNGYNVNIVKKFSEDRTPIQLPRNNTVLVIED